MPYSATFVSADQGWVLGTAPCPKVPCTSIIRTLDGGTSWKGIPAPVAPIGDAHSLGAGAVSTIRFADQADGWVAGRALYSTHDGGASWHRSPLDIGSGVVAGLETAGGEVYASVDTCAETAPLGCVQRTTVYATPVRTDRWAAVSPALAGGTEKIDLVVQGTNWYLSSPSGLYRGSASAAPARLADACPADGSRIVSPAIAVADAQHLDAICGSQGAAGSATYQLYGTSDGGEHWTKAGPSHREASGLYGIADNGHGVLLLSVASGGSEILRSNDDGARLAAARISTATGGIAWSDLGFTTADQAVVVLSHTALYLSHDSGSSWAPVRY